MNIFTRLATTLLAVLGLVAILASPASAQSLTASDMSFAFGGKATSAAAAPAATTAPVAIASARGMTQTEMQETQGAVAPVVVYGLAVAGRIAYVGITNNLARRTAQHAATRSFDSVVRLGSSTTRNGARVIEQNNINRFNTINRGWNRINSISPRNPLSSRVTQPYRR
ncbi:hypothetical protein A8B83_11175 [Rhodobacteraceae bacterium EhC02]|jgi:hypothetical protein|nr:hypothetical protein [Paracoccaceae bacterium]OAN71787.1 hypothetical protein A8B83_11175 [Rhodobacteraceae bacterium EhC02]